MNPPGRERPGGVCCANESGLRLVGLVALAAALADRAERRVHGLGVLRLYGLLHGDRVVGILLREGFPRLGVAQDHEALGVLGRVVPLPVLGLTLDLGQVAVGLGVPLLHDLADVGQLV